MKNTEEATRRMVDTECERGLQVVRVEDSRYKLDEDALQALLLREDVADCRVALVSVAGAYRGGKSFLLDFLLRYLRAEEAARADGSWIGAECEALVGFNWRGGSERDTTGLLLWSGPVRVTLPSGEPVAVLLMDTQGTFDSGSTLRDYSTIFALSTLLSSVQIYNLKENINEDDLQHLQLFTEYGRLALASNDGSKPFQSLHLLIRDWSYDYEHPYGAEGGKQLLEKRLEISEGQAAELKELRQHIRACFDSLDCFLMPHPGFTVYKPEFHGYLSDIRDEFKKFLMQLTPLILEPKNLVVKKINGQPMTGRELFIHFKEYMNVFNSDTVPLPVSILKATAEACLLSGMVTVREQYNRVMVQLKAVARETLRQRHECARDDAVRAFVAKKTMADGKEVERYAQQLVQELDALLPNYELLNEEKIKKAVANATLKYEKMVLRDHSAENLCLHPLDLNEAHRRGLEEAIDEIDINTDDEKFADDQKAALVQAIEDKLLILIAKNARNNENAVLEAINAYKEYMAQKDGDDRCFHPEDLKQRNENGRNDAFNVFTGRSTAHRSHFEDEYKNKLTLELNKIFEEIEATNTQSNISAVIESYEEYSKCFSIIEIKFLTNVLRTVLYSRITELHGIGLRAALYKFRMKRHEGPFHLRDRYRECLEKVTRARYEHKISLAAYLTSFYPPWTTSKDWWSKSLDRYLSSDARI